MWILLGHIKVKILIVVNAHLKWLEVIQMSFTSAEQKIVVLRKFTTYGLPLQLV